MTAKKIQEADSVVVPKCQELEMLYYLLAKNKQHFQAAWFVMEYCNSIVYLSFSSPSLLASLKYKLQ